MSDIQYDTRTGAVMMAAGTSGSQRSGAATKKILAHLRDICVEARHRSNQELIQLLENYNDQTVTVAEALRTGEADTVLGGWAPTKKPKKNKKSESDTGNENASVSSINNKIKPAPVPNQNQPQNTGKVNGSQQNPGKSNPANSTPNQNSSTKSTINQQSNGNNSGQPNSRPLDPIGTIKPQPTTESNNSKKTSKKQTENTVQQIKEVPAPDLHAYLSDFSRLQHQLNETMISDMEALDLAFAHVRRELDHRQENLRRSLLHQKEYASDVLGHRQQQARELTDRIAQSHVMNAQELEEYRQVAATFAVDYKFDLHLASLNRLQYSLEPLQMELTKFGNVATFVPTYTYKSPIGFHSTNMTLSSPQSSAFPPTQTQQNNNNQSRSGNNSFSGDSKMNYSSNVNGGYNQPQHNSNANNSTQSPRNNQQPQQNSSLRNNQNNNGPSSARNQSTIKSTSNGQNAKSRSSNSTSGQNNGNNRNLTSQNAEPQMEIPRQERITIMPMESSTAAPMNSLVISGGNLSAEELAEITKCLQLSYLPPTPRHPPPPSKNVNLGYSTEADLLGGGSAIWINSSASVENANWEKNLNGLNNNNNNNNNGSANIRPVGDHLQRGGGVPRRGGPRGGRGGNGRGGGNSSSSRGGNANNQRGNSN